jgi:TM2 domain-containing membrane protein YozV
MPSAVPGQPSIVIQNVQAQQAPAFAGGNIKNPGVALLLSLIFPGGGQFYNGHAGKGLIVLFTFWLVIPYIWSLFDAYSCAKRINRVGF